MSIGAEMIDLRVIVDTRSISGQQGRALLSQRIQDHVYTLNGVYRESDVRLRSRLVAVDYLPIAERDAERLLKMMTDEQGPFVGLFTQASYLGADYTIVYVRGLTIRGKHRCGRAVAVNLAREDLASTRKALAVLDIACGPLSLAHELGHLMGLNHGELVDRCQPDHGHTTAAAPYALGYAIGNCDGQPQVGEFGTIMVGGWMRAIYGDQHHVVPMYSNPRVKDPRCGKLHECGNDAIGDAARFLNENAFLYSGHETARIGSDANVDTPKKIRP
ncbi:zinc-dependent metalloprotease family protein [Thiohalocapsa marina]|nr:zinc-dependent metalloprotease family protein [Thiohalocapsa marina]